MEEISALSMIIFKTVIFSTSIWNVTCVSFTIETVMSFVLGSYVGKIGKENPYKSGLKYAVITIAGALIAYLVGEILDIVF